MSKASRFLAYGIGLLAAFFLALATFSIMIQFVNNPYDAAIISIIPFAIFSGAWILTLRLVFKI
ncbi:MAG: hypothetical protein H3Z53_09800 [archaeon]|nr:hypothetical protein [archaeon]MCP8314644.1 hypothetical protein [archaeon]MCP8322519.1 hypothetical protein [archaeon]